MELAPVAGHPRRCEDAGAGTGRPDQGGYGHISLQKTPVGEYCDDLVQGQLFPETIMAETGGESRWFRPPFNHTGPSPEAKEELLTFLEERGLELAPFTVEHSDYIFNDLYEDARSRKDQDAVRKVGQVYRDLQARRASPGD